MAIKIAKRVVLENFRECPYCRQTTEAGVVGHDIVVKCDGCGKTIKLEK